MWMNFSALWPTKYASSPIEVAHAMPPSAFQNRKVGHDMRVAPAIHAAVMRSPVTQRPRKTALGPWRSKNGSPTAMTRRR